MNVYTCCSRLFSFWCWSIGILQLGKHVVITRLVRETKNNDTNNFRYFFSVKENAGKFRTLFYSNHLIGFKSHVPSVHQSFLSLVNDM